MSHKQLLLSFQNSPNGKIDFKCLVTPEWRVERDSWRGLCEKGGVAAAAATFFGGNDLIGRHKRSRTLASSKRASEIPPQALPYIPCSVTATPFSGSSFSSIRLPSHPLLRLLSQLPPLPGPPLSVKPAPSVLHQPSSSLLMFPCLSPLPLPSPPPPPPHLWPYRVLHQGLQFWNKWRQKHRSQKNFLPLQSCIFFVFIVVGDIPTKGLVLCLRLLLFCLGGGYMGGKGWIFAAPENCVQVVFTRQHAAKDGEQK